jgi:flagellar biosynthesis anti-sigma factor FlgM
MRIHDAYTKLDRPTAADGAAPTGDAATRAKDAARSAGTSTSVNTSVSLSPRARELSAASATSTAKVAALRDKLQRGELQVDAHAIAGKLVGVDA